MARDRDTPPRPTPQPATAGFWPGYLEGGYFDAAGNLRVEYVDREHMEPLARAMGNAKLTTSQVRRFFSHCRAIERQLEAHGRSADALERLWAAEYPAFVRLDVFAADALAKPKIPPLFHDFIRRNVSAVKTHTDFLQGFIPHFEALVGFGARHFDKTDRG